MIFYAFFKGRNLLLISNNVLNLFFNFKYLSKYKNQMPIQYNKITFVQSISNKIDN